jgi:DNA invertase Pin-like site-specific DNA recombinase
MSFSVEVIKANRKLSDRTGGQQEILRVAPYARVSTDTEEQLNSYKSQVSYYKEMVGQRSDWILADMYADEAITGTQVKKRDDFQRLINDCLNGKIDMVITKSISRFARNTVDTLKYVRMLKEKNVAVFFEKENINTLTMDGELLLTILSSVAQQEVENISSIVKMGLKMKMQRGELVGFQSCLGYDYDLITKRISVNKEEAEIVRYIFDRYIVGVGASVIAKELTKLPHKTKRGNMEWGDTAVLGIIKNEKYKGDLLQGKTFTLDPISKRRLDNHGEEDQYYIKNHHEPIISEEIFEKAQDILYRRGKPRGKLEKGGKREKFSRKFTFSCKLECGFCGKNYSRRSWNSRTTYAKVIWQCVSFSKKGKKYCPHSKGIDENIIEGAFVETYNRVCGNHKDVLDELLLRMESVFSEQQHHKLLNKVKHEIQALEQKRSNLIDLHLDEKIDRSTYENKYDELEFTLSELINEREQLETSAQEEIDVEKRLQQFRNVLQSNTVLSEFDRNVFESVIERVIMGEEQEDGSVEPYQLTFVFKTGLKSSIQGKSGMKSPKKLAAERSDACPHFPHNTYRKCRPSDKTIWRETKINQHML